MQRPCGQWSETPCHIDCATVGEWNAANYDWAKRARERRQEREHGLWAELERAAEQYAQIPEYLRPVITVPRRAGKTAALEAIQRQLEEGRD